MVDRQLPRYGLPAVGVLLILLSATFFRSPLLRVLEDRAADRFPDRTVEMIVSFKEGGGTDIGARLLAGYLAEELGQPVFVRNIDGKDGEVGYTELSRARPNGYTIGFINLPTFMSLAGQRETRYRVSHITPLANYVLDPAVLVVRADSKWHDFESWLDYCRRNPLKMTVSNNGIAASNHIAAARLEYYSGSELTHVPFGGTADMLRALEEGYVEASVAKISEVADAAEAGRLRVLASFTDTRHSQLPGIPTLSEKGFPLAMGSARALAVPTGVHPEVMEKLYKAYVNAFHNPDHIREAGERRLSLHYMSGDDVLQYMREQEAFLSETLPRIGI
ncbi:MAG: tripartite tricarboxylate transporter substrate binding protein [Spirochaetaceae bacterium]|nr:MAG: tripartite tricarboxylate transporter substrate binding protein [Spirochaetaceae bacterium]